MALANAGSALARRQMHNAFLFRCVSTYILEMYVYWYVPESGRILLRRRKCSGGDCFKSTNRACKWVTIHGVTQRDWSLLGTK